MNLCCYVVAACVIFELSLLDCMSISVTLGKRFPANLCLLGGLSIPFGASAGIISGGGGERIRSWCGTAVF